MLGSCGISHPAAGPFMSDEAAVLTEVAALGVTCVPEELALAGTPVVVRSGVVWLGSSLKTIAENGTGCPS